MKYFIKTKAFSKEKSTKVTDENDQIVFIVKRKTVSPLKKTTVKDAEGQTLFSSRNAFWGLFGKKAFVRDSEKKRVCKIKTRGMSAFVTKIADDEYTVRVAKARKKELTKNGQLLCYTERAKNGTLALSFPSQYEEAAQGAAQGEIPSEQVALYLAILLAANNLRKAEKEKNRNSDF